MEGNGKPYCNEAEKTIHDLWCRIEDEVSFSYEASVKVSKDLMKVVQLQHEVIRRLMGCLREVEKVYGQTGSSRGMPCIRCMGSTFETAVAAANAAGAATAKLAGEIPRITIK